SLPPAPPSLSPAPPCSHLSPLPCSNQILASSFLHMSMLWGWSFAQSSLQDLGSCALERCWLLKEIIMLRLSYGNSWGKLSFEIILTTWHR
ncbi:hypothetical protein KC19_7G170100, partial [Ceratodon purpureus]